MFSLSPSIAVLFLAASTALAQSSAAGSGTESGSAALPSSTAGLTPCIISCVTPAATAAGCQGFADIACVCSSQSFQQAAGACLQANCTAQDVATAQGLQQAECAAISASGSAGGASGSDTGSAAVPSATAPGATGSSAPAGTGAGGATGSSAGASTSAGAGSASSAHASTGSPSASAPATTNAAVANQGVLGGVVGALFMALFGLTL